VNSATPHRHREGACADRPARPVRCRRWPTTGLRAPEKLDVKAGHRVLLDRAVKVCAVDDVWSGLELVIRMENR
jgi:hypothetical protein